MAAPTEIMARWPLRLFGESGKMSLTILAEGANDKTLTKRDQDRIAKVSRLFPEACSSRSCTPRRPRKDMPLT